MGLVCGGLLSCTSAVARGARAPTPGEAHLKVMSFNVNFGLGGDPATLAAMALGEADIIALQETNARWARSIEAAYGEAYPHRRFIDAPAAGGSAILSRYPILKHQRLSPKAGWFAASLSLIDTPLGPLQLLNVHLRPAVSNSGSFVMGYFTTEHIRVAEITDFLEAVDPTLPLIALGDFNEEPGSAALARLITARKMHNLLPDFYPKATTWRWRMYGLDFTAMLDHILISPELEALSAEVLSAGRSDHLPVLATLVRAAR
ncbi:endonuclease/exonuclease/phosphatase family protein [Myxococcota bacterium]|nr:endonuclease/exonuclease/phosphatase family protein [Myxococcota bacterium]MBU1898682.1 endonuclease/exonuclease/phosphatase family protein [Myxococcota bacterium]